MLYLKRTIRNLRSNIFVPVVKISAYAIGFSVVFFAVAYAFNEINYNNNFVEDREVFQLTYHNADEDAYYSRFPKTIKEKFFNIPDILDITKIDGSMDGNVIGVNDSIYYYEKTAVTDSSFFDVFQTSFIAGSPILFKKKPRSVVITKKLAKKLFKDENPVGNNILMGSYGRMEHHEIVGVVNNWPNKSTIQSDILINGENYIYSSWDVEFFFTAKKGTYAAKLDEKFNHTILDDLSVAIDNNNTEKKNILIKTVHITDVHFLPSNYELRWAYSRGDKTMVITILTLAFGVFLIILVNNTILTIASTSKRSKELGILKAFGAKPSQVFKALSFENIIFVSIGGIISIVLLKLLNRQITGILYDANKVMDKDNSLFGIDNMFLFISILTGIVILTVLLTGLISTVYVYKSSTIEVLRLKSFGKPGKNHFTDGLSIGQLIISTLLITGILGIYKQLHYTTNKDYGYDFTNVFTSQMNPNPNEEFRKDLMDHPDIEYVTFSSMPTRWYLKSENIFRVNEPYRQFGIYKLPADYYYIETFGMEIVEGRNFDMQLYDRENKSILINETAAKSMGINTLPEETNFGTIIGIVKDFHTDILKVKILPMLLYFDDYYGSMSVKVKPTNDPSRVSTDDEITVFLFDKYKENSPSDYNMYNNTTFSINRDKSVSIINGSADLLKWTRLGEKNDFEYEYSNDRKTAGIGLFLTILAILVSALGLFGVCMFSTLLKTKEVGVRKINGARTGNVIWFFVQGYIFKTLISMAIAFPISFYGIKKYFDTYAYHTELNWWLFALTGILTMLFVVVTVLWQSRKAATINPVEALRYE